MKTLADCRVAIDTIDDELVTLINKRMRVVERVGEIKSNNNSAVYRPEREKEIIERLNELSKSQDGILNKDAIEAIFLELFAISRNLEKKEKIAYLGPEGSFTHQAAESRFGAMSEYLSLGSIYSVFKTLEAGRAKFGVVPIENSRDGVVGETLDLLASSSIKIVAEVYMPIHMAFASNSESISKLTKIYSKDKGFGQCREFLQEHGLDSVEHIPVESTAKAAILAANEPNSAAICSHIAAKLYGVPTMFENIEDEHSNQTRFFILSDFKNGVSEYDKTSIVAKLTDSQKSGALVEFLEDFNDAKINLSKIESRPSHDDNGFSYQFFIDFYGHIDEEHIKNVVKKHSNEIIWLGSYVGGEKNEVQ
ncbi:MAG: prephenate dehydratase [Campylobacterota bacterium]|nr:prephenate dehydratase [Campylobacterota bacterium]